MLLRFAAPVAGGDDRRRRRSSPPSSIRSSCGKSAATTSSASPISRANTTAARRAPARPRRSRWRCTRAPMYFYKQGQGPLPQGAARGAEGGARVGRAQGARGASRSRTGSRSSRARRLPDAVARRSSHAALQAGQERARMEGARAPRATRADESRRRCCARAARFRRRTTIISTLPRRGVSAGQRLSRAWGALPPLPELPDCAGARVLDRRRDDDRDRRRVLGARRSPTATTRSASTSPRPRSLIAARHAARCASRARGCRPCTCPGRKLTMLPEDAIDAFTLARAARRPRCRSTSRSRPTARRCAHATRVERVPIAANLRLDAIDEAFANDLPSPSRSAVDARSCACCGSSRSSCRAARGKADVDARSTTASTSTGTRAPGDGPRDDRAARARQPARQARRRADDPRQQHVGPAARRCRRAGPVPRAGRAAR